MTHFKYSTLCHSSAGDLLSSSRNLSATRLCFASSTKVEASACFEYKGADEEHEHFMTDLDATLREFGLKQSSNPFRRVFGWWIQEVREAWEHCRNIQDLGARILQAYRTKPKKSQNKTLIRLLVENPHFPGDRERIAEILTFLVAGIETTGYTLHITSCVSFIISHDGSNEAFMIASSLNFSIHSSAIVIAICTMRDTSVLEKE